METSSHFEEKKTRKYTILKRAAQAKIIEGSKQLSERDPGPATWRPKKHSAALDRYFS